MPGRRRFIAALSLAVLLAGGVFAPAVRAAALAQLRTFLAETRAARGEFTQKVMRVDGSVAESGSGDFAFARPGRFRWEVRKPFEQLLVADGQRLWFYDQDLNQATVRPMSDSLVSTPAAILFGDADLERDFALRELAPRDGLEWVEALPRSKEAGFERITLGMRDGLPVTMQVVDAFGRTTVFGFHAIVRNGAPAPELFRYVPPKGVDVVEQ